MAKEAEERVLERAYDMGFDYGTISALDFLSLEMNGLDRELEQGEITEDEHLELAKPLIESINLILIAEETEVELDNIYNENLSGFSKNTPDDLLKEVVERGEYFSPMFPDTDPSSIYLGRGRQAIPVAEAQSIKEDLIKVSDELDRQGSIKLSSAIDKVIKKLYN